jgi:hypothetical protein
MLPPGAPPGAAPPILPPEAALSQAAAMSGMDPALMSQTAMQVMPAGAHITIDLKLKRTVRNGRVRIEACPANEVLIDRNARSIDTASYVIHRMTKTVSELLEMGFDAEIVEGAAGNTLDDLTEEEQFRTEGGNWMFGDDENTNPSQRRVRYCETYLRYTGEDDGGVASLHRVCTVGPDCEVVFCEKVARIPFVYFQCAPMPHTWMGQSLADLLVDIQVTKSSIMRSGLESLAQAIHQKLVIGKSVNIEDALSNETAGIIRAGNVADVHALVTPVVANESLGFLGYLDQVKAQRTGITPQSQGLDADILQSTSAKAVDMMQQGATQSLELMARSLAETGVRPLAKLVLQLVHENQNRPRMIRLRDEFVEIDPSLFDSEMDVSIEVGGRDHEALRTAALAEVIGKQEQIFQVLGVSNPIVGVEQWRNAIGEYCELKGLKDSSRYFAPITPEIMQQMQAQAGQAKPDANMELVRVEAMKAQAEAQAALMRIELEREKLRLEDDRARDKSAMEFQLKMAEIQARYGAQVDTASLKAEVDRERFFNSELGKIAQSVIPQQQPDPSMMPQPEMPPMPPQMQPPMPGGHGF